MARTALRSLKNADYSDRELLHVLNDLADPDGWSSSHDLAHTLGIGAPETLSKREKENYAVRCVATRFSWMVRFGWVERNSERTKWRLTPVGRDLMNGKLTKTLETGLNKLSPGDRVLVMRSLTGAYRADRQEAATMLRREWQHGSHRNGKR